MVEPTSPPPIRRARLRVRWSRLQARRDELVERAVAGRRHRSVDFLFRAFEHDRDAGGALLASALAYRLFLWLLPATLILVGCLGFVPPGSAGEGAATMGLGSDAAHEIEQSAAQVSDGRWVLLVFGLCTLAWASSNLARAMWAATLLAWQLPIRRLEREYLASGFVVVGVLVAATTALVANWMRAQRGAWSVLAVVFMLMVFLALGWSLLRALPHPEEVSAWGLVPGAVVFAIGVEILHVYTVVYLSSRYTTQVYGVLGGAATFLLWGYLLSRLLIGATTINRVWHSSPLVETTTTPDAFIAAWQGRTTRRR
jgi:uncharacterized BrkB/YihY/UPF0761 family membrane protein